MESYSWKTSDSQMVKPWNLRRQIERRVIDGCHAQTILVRLVKTIFVEFTEL